MAVQFLVFLYDNSGIWQNVVIVYDILCDFNHKKLFSKSDGQGQELHISFNNLSSPR